MGSRRTCRLESDEACVQESVPVDLCRLAPLRPHTKPHYVCSIASRGCTQKHKSIRKTGTFLKGTNARTDQINFVMSYIQDKMPCTDI